jgi:hypothetical protein
MSDTFKKDIIFSNKIAFIGDEFTYNGLKNNCDITYIKKVDIDKIDYNCFDLLWCDSTWNGIYNDWKFGIYKYQLENVVKKFNNLNKYTLFYNKEDPISYNKFITIAELFDVILTTSYNCIDKYKNKFPNKIILNFPFVCDPVQHNPIRLNSEILPAAVFFGGFYSNLKNRNFNTYKLFDNIINNDISLLIFNRFYGCKGIFKIDDKYLKYNYNKIDSKLIYKYYKKYKLSINTNTVTDCKTMCSRRLIELLACGCNVLSNNSKSIEYLNLPVLFSVSNEEFNELSDINYKGVEIVNLNYTYPKLLEYIYSNLNLNLNLKVKYNVKIKDKNSIENYNHIKEKFNIIYTDDKDIIIYLDKYNYYTTTMVNKILSYIYYFDGNVCMTNDINKNFRVYNGLFFENIIIKNNTLHKTLFVSNF